MIYYALLLFFVLEYVRPASYFPPLAILYSIVPAGVIIGTFIGKSSVTNREVLGETNTKFFLALLALIVLSTIVADVTMYTFTVFTTVLGYVLLYWVIVRRATDLRRIEGLFVTLIFIHVVLALLTPQMFLDPGTRHYIASGTFLGDGNDYALSVTVAIPFCLFLMFHARKALLKVAFAVSGLFLILCVVLTQSRGGTLALGAVGLYYWSKSDKKAVTAALGVVAVAVVLALAPGNYFQRMNSITDYENDGSAQGRITAWQAGIGMAMSNPLLGVGAGQFPGNSVKFAPPGPDGPVTRWKTAHSIYFLILGELGLPGIILLFTIIVSNLSANRRVATEIRAQATGGTIYSGLLACLSASMLAYAVGGAFLSAAYYPHMFVVAGLATAARRQARESLLAAAAEKPAPALVVPLPAHRAVRSRVASVSPPIARRHGRIGR